MMKIRHKLIATALIVLGFASQSFAQATASADAFATIVAPLSIVKVTDMNFGNVAVQSAFAGTVVLDPTGSRSATGGVSFPGSIGTVSAASFDVTGEGGFTYDIILPGAPVDLSDGLGNLISVADFMSNPGTGTLSAGGTQTISIGATLYVSAGQAPGVYSSTSPFDVMVNYN